MAAVHERADRVEVATRHRTRDRDAYLLSAVHQLPVRFVVSCVEHDTAVQLEVRGFGRRLSAFQVFRGCDDITNAPAERSSDHAGILQLSEADRDVNVFRDQVVEEIRDEEVDADPWMVL